MIESLRYERYVNQSAPKPILKKRWLQHAYYLVRPLLPVAVRKHLQKIYLRGWESLPFPQWPVDCSVDSLCAQWLLRTMQAQHIDCLPFIWFWPAGHTACAMVTHDVETPVGRDFSGQVMDIDDAFGIKTSFQIVPEKRYDVPQTYLDSIRERGFEICLQGLNHDGNLFQERQSFLEQATKINQYAQHFGAQGFRSPVLYRNVDWFQDLCFSYDMSIPNVGHLDPQPGGCCTVMPYFLPGGVLELPLTTIQDYSLFHILGQYSLALWQQQARLIMARHGLMSFIIHPDYITHNPPQELYRALLDYLNQLRSHHAVWIALPGEVNRWWRDRQQMALVADGAGWHIEGPGSDRARLAYARIDRDRLVYDIEPPHSL